MASLSFSNIDMPTSAVDRVIRIREGLPYTLLDRVVEKISPQSPTLRYEIVAKATLARRKRENRLSADESAKLARLSELMEKAVQVWKSDEAARAFLFRPHPLLQMRTPISVAMMNEFGADLVRDILLRLEHGTSV